MESLATPATLATLVARNLVPALGVLFFGWSAGNLLVLYWIDTTLAFTVVIVLVARHVTGLGAPGKATVPLAGPLDWIRVSAGALVGALLICMPLAVPLVMLLDAFDWSLRAAMADRGFLVGLAMQVGTSITGGISAHRELLARSDDEHILKHRAAFIIARWMVVVFAGTVGPFALLGPRFGGALIVLAYAAGSVYFEAFPGRALRWLNPKEAAGDAARPRQARVPGRRR